MVLYLPIPRNGSQSCISCATIPRISEPQSESKPVPHCVEGLAYLKYVLLRNIRRHTSMEGVAVSVPASDFRHPDTCPVPKHPRLVGTSDGNIKYSGPQVSKPHLRPSASRAFADEHRHDLSQLEPSVCSPSVGDLCEESGSDEIINK